MASLFAIVCCMLQSSPESEEPVSVIDEVSSGAVTVESLGLGEVFLGGEDEPRLPPPPPPPPPPRLFI